MEPSGPGGYILGGCERNSSFLLLFRFAISEVYLCELISSRESTLALLSVMSEFSDPYGL